MDLYFPLPVTTLELCQEAETDILSPLLVKPHFKVSESDIQLDIYNVAKIRISEGKHIRVYPYPDGDASSVNLFLNGSALGALLHQRGVLPFHGNSFQYKSKGILLCGNAGAGKSSVSTAFCQHGATFINDDITPVDFQDDVVWISSLKSDIKLWDDSLQKLGLQNDNLVRIRPNLNKFFLPASNCEAQKTTLNHIFILSTHNEPIYVSTNLTGLIKFQILQQMIYRKLYLNGMPEAKKQNFGRLMKIAANIRVTNIVRPLNANIYDTMSYIRNIIEA